MAFMSSVDASHYIPIHLCALLCRYSDFMVHEIDQNGGMVVLSDFSLPPDDEDKDVRLVMHS